MIASFSNKNEREHTGRAPGENRHVRQLTAEALVTEKDRKEVCESLIRHGKPKWETKAPVSGGHGPGSTTDSFYYENWLYC